MQVFALIHEGAEGVGISFPDFPGCVSGGASIDEAIARGRDTLAFHVAGMVEDGDTLPTLRSLQELRQDPEFCSDAEGAIVALVPVELPAKAVRINISMDESLLERVDRAAKTRGETRSGFLAAAAKARLVS
jgi:predicted RNase H-like HicB family nuclease